MLARRVVEFKHTRTPKAKATMPLNMITKISTEEKSFKFQHLLNIFNEWYYLIF